MPLARYYHRRERFLAALNAHRIVRPFEWGKEFADAAFLNGSKNSPPVSFWKHYAENVIQNSDQFFAIPEISGFKFEAPNLTWTSQIQTISA